MNSPVNFKTCHVQGTIYILREKINLLIRFCCYCRFTFQGRINRGVTLSWKKLDCILNLQVQKEQKQWIDVAVENYTLTDVEGGSFLTIHNLKSERKYNIRMLTKSKTDEIYIVTTTANPIFIKGKTRKNKTNKNDFGMRTLIFLRKTRTHPFL